MKTLSFLFMVCLFVLCLWVGKSHADEGDSVFSVSFGITS